MEGCKDNSKRMASPHSTEKEVETSDLNSANSLNELGIGFFPTDSGEEPRYPDTLLFAC